jgi:hypothetical protein
LAAGSLKLPAHPASATTLSAFAISPMAGIASCHDVNVSRHPLPLPCKQTSWSQAYVVWLVASRTWTSYASTA